MNHFALRQRKYFSLFRTNFTSNKTQETNDEELLGFDGQEEEEGENMNNILQKFQQYSISRKKDQLNLSEQEMTNSQSMMIQKANVLAELKNGEVKDEYWPNRPVKVDMEFPNITQSMIDELKKRGLVVDDNPIQAAAILQRLRGNRKKEKKIEDLQKKEELRPDWHRQVITVDQLNVSNKLTLSLPLNNSTSNSTSSQSEKDSSKDSEILSGGNLALTELNSFKKLGIISDSLLDTLKRQWKITAPTEIQSLAIPEILKGSNIFVADQTGMGKTLCYVLPLLTRLKEMESSKTFRRRGQRSRSIILVPTRELVLQVVNVITVCLESKEFSHMKVLGMAGGLSTDNKEQIGFTPGLDVLVTTGDRLSFHLEKAHFNLDDTKIFIVDEADTIFSIDTLKIQLLNFVYKLEVATMSRLGFPLQFVWVSATVSEKFADFISDRFPNTIQAFHPKLHKTVDGLKQHFIFGKGDFKSKMLFETLKKNKGKRTMIFCNSLEVCKNVHVSLDKRGYKTCLAISTQASRKRAQNFEQFSKGETPILISTDLASRGIDTNEVIEHVILFDFPQNVIDYIHRIGRTARNGKKGMATSFVGKWDQALAQKIRSAFENGSSLSAVTTKLRSLDKKKKKYKVEGKIRQEYLNEFGQLKNKDSVLKNESLRNTE